MRDNGYIIAMLMLAAAAGAKAQVNDNNCGLAGFATYADMGLRGTTGGASGEVVRVTTRDDLQRLAGDDVPRMIIIDADITGKGNIGEGAAGVKDVISVGSNKTIVGGGSGATLRKVGLDVNGKHNIILRNLRVTACNPDALAFRNAHHVWVDHCDLSASADGLLDYTLGSSYLSVSWTKFSDHDKVSICNSGTQHFEDRGRERATYHHCWFDHTTQRNPRFGYGLGHVFNNYYTDNSSYCVGYHTGAKVVVENSLFSNTHSPLNQMYTSVPTEANYADCLARGNKYVSVSGNTKDTGRGFDISRFYSYDMLLDEADGMAELSQKAGLADGLEYDLIPFPGNGANGVTEADRLSVGPISGASEYNYYIGIYADGAQSMAPYTSVTQLEPQTTYAWYATAQTADRTYHSSEFRFTTAPEKASCPLPLDGEEHAQLREALVDKSPLTPLRLQWREAFDAKTYRVYLSEGESVGEDDLIGETAATWLRPESLRYGVRYAWRVDAVKADGTVVEGDTWTFSSADTDIQLGKTELETAQLSGYAYLEQESSYREYSGGYAVVGEAGPGAMSMTWTGGATCCDVTTTYFDWQSASKYKGSFALYVNGERRDAWLSLSDGKNMIDHVSKDVYLKDGDELRLEFYTDDKMRLRSDCITLRQAASSGIVDADAQKRQRTISIYTLDGRYVGSDASLLPSGIYVSGGRKFLKD